MRVPLENIFYPAPGSKTTRQVEGIHVPAILEEGSTTFTLRLDGEMEIGDALDLKRLLLVALGSRKEMRIELIGVTELDITSMQLLWAAVTEASTIGSSISFEDPIPEYAASSLSQAGLCSLRGRHQ